jgi:hypothetical protein
MDTRYGHLLSSAIRRGTVCHTYQDIEVKYAYETCPADPNLLFDILSTQYLEACLSNRRFISCSRTL